MPVDDSTFSYAYIVGRGPGGYQYRIGVDARPDLNDVDSFAAVLYHVSGDENLVEIARIDDTVHEEDDGDESVIHIHRWYRERRVQDRDYALDVTNWWEADAYLQDNFERFARRYIENHGDSIAVCDNRDDT